MKKEFLLLLLTVISAVVFSQPPELLRPNYTYPYFQGSIRVKDTLGIDIISPDDSSLVRITDDVRMDSTLQVGGNITPLTTDAYDIGSSTMRYKGLYLTSLLTEGVKFGTGNFVSEEGGTIYIDAQSSIRVRYQGNQFFGITNIGAFVASNFRPSSNNSFSLGITTLYFSNTFSNAFTSNAGAGRIWQVTASDNTTVGSNLTINAGGNTAGGTADLNGGMLTLSAGQTKGTGMASLRLQSNTRSATTNTVLNTVVDRLIIPSEKNLTDATDINLFEVAIGALAGSGGVVEFNIVAVGTDTVSTYSGVVRYTINSANATILTTISEISALPGNNPVGVVDITTLWKATAGVGKATISVNADVKFVPTSIKISYKIFNGGSTAVTQL